jgi:Chitobiase/beta-hexosaminidase C-terminal domain/Right handed beta helix region
MSSTSFIRALAGINGSICELMTADFRSGGHETIPIAVLLLLALQCAVARASTYNVNPSQTEATIQGIIDTVSPGDTISFSSGTYMLSAPLAIRCDVTYSGPNNGILANGLPNAATAELTAPEATGQFDLFVGSGCSSLTVAWLHFNNAGAISIDSPGSGYTGSAGIYILFNQFTGLPATLNPALNAAMFFNADVSGISGGYITNLTIYGNTFGDPTSCAQPTNVMINPEDDGGGCAGVYFSTNMKNVLIENNRFIHLEEGIKALCTQNQCDPRPPHYQNTIADNVIARNNDFDQIHRIGIEFQFQPTLPPITFAYNSFHDFYMPYWSTMGISGPCCNLGGSGYSDIGNVLIANEEGSPYIAYGLEWWGAGSQATGNLVQGNWKNGIAWGFGQGGTGWAIRDNYICGPLMSAGGNPLNNGFINDEENSDNLFGFAPPALSGNIESASCSPTTTVAPKILQTSLGVELSDPQPNVSLYYTTDGSTPGTSSTLYTAPFDVANGSTVKAIAMWGRGANPSGYAAGYGYVPSNVVTKKITASPMKNLVSAFLVSKGAVASIPVGSTLQFIANGVYSDGTVVPLPDSEGDVVTAWNTSNHAVAKINSLGHVTAMGVGTVTIEGMIDNLEASTLQLTVTAPPAVRVEATTNSSLPEVIPEDLETEVQGQYLGP